jgi:D-glycero-alpha-D-manno-heptose-7-phosphate kinase
MIISKTPYRVDLIGDGTDIGSFCERERGCIINAAIQRYIHLIIHPSYDQKIRIVCDDKTEIKENTDEVENGRVKESLRKVGINKGVVIHTVSDSPTGIGLGGSSSFTVGLLNALYAYQGKTVGLERLAEEASEIEIDILKEPIGRQDQYAAAYGGLNKMEFINRRVKVSGLTSNNKIIKEIEDKFMLFYLGEQRKTSSILERQNKEMRESYRVFNSMKDMRNLADKIAEEIYFGRIKEFGETLRKNWEIKKGLIQGITTPAIERYCELSFKFGAEGAKLAGAGGTGFLLVYAESEKHERIRDALKELKECPIKFEKRGSRIVYNN